MMATNLLKNARLLRKNKNVSDSIISWWYGNPLFYNKHTISFRTRKRSLNYFLLELMASFNLLSLKK